MAFAMANETDQFTTCFTNLIRITSVMLHLSVVVHSNTPKKLVSTNHTYKLQLEDDLLDGGLHNVALAPLREVAQVLPVESLPLTSFLCLFKLLWVLNILSQPMQTNSWPLCCRILCWLGVGKYMKALSQTLQG